MSVNPAQGSSATAEFGDRVVGKIARRVIPLMGLLYLVSFLDRVNIGFAALTMNADLGLTPAMFGIGSGIFFAGYIVFEIPSNVILQRVGARRWIARIMISWGLVSAAIAFINGPTAFYVLRFLLGIAEAGFFPGMVLYLTYWFPAAYRGRVLGAFLLALPLSNIVGAPVSTALLELNAGGLKGWQWMFLLEGLPAILLGLLTLRYLRDSPADASWLNLDERDWLEREFAHERSAGVGTLHVTLWDAIRNPRVWLLGFVYFGICIGLYTFAFWLPQIIKSIGGLSNRQTGLITMIPYSLAGGLMFLWGRYSDHHRTARQWHILLPAMLGAFGLGMSALPHLPPIMGLIAISIAASGLYASLPTFWTLPPLMLRGAAAAAGIALINALGNFGGFLGPSLLGVIKDATGSYAPSLWSLAALLLLAGILARVIKIDEGIKRHH